MRLLALIVPFAIFCGSIAQAEELKMISGHCGDHWFKVHFTADVKTKKASVSFSGDSGVNKDLTGTLVRASEDYSFRINFNEPEKGYLEIDGSDYFHNLYWGALSPTGLRRDEHGMGLCSVDWEK